MNENVCTMVNLYTSIHRYATRAHFGAVQSAGLLYGGQQCCKFSNFELLAV